MRVKLVVLSILVLFFSFTFVSKSFALNQNPNLNIGSTNILDAVIPPPGLHMLNYITYYTADEIRLGDQPMPGDNELDVMVYTPQLVYTPDADLPHNLRLGLSTMLPLQSINLDSSIGLQENQNIVGDLVVGAFIGSAVPLSKNYTLHWFFQLDSYLPIGDYNQDKAINPSANYVTLEPFFSLTLQMPQGLALSSRQHFTYNFKNDEYLHHGVEGDLQAGPMYHFNYSLSKTLPFVAPEFRIAAVGYYLQQLSNDKFEGDKISDSQERVFAIGPGISWIHKGMFLGFKVMFESGAENRAEGIKSMLQIRFKF